MLADILRPINEANGRANKQQEMYTFERFCHSVYLPMFQRKWKGSTCDTETDRIEYHLVRELGPKRMKEISDEQLQQLLNERAKNRSQSVVDHLRFRLRSMFNVALSKGIVDRNAATELYTPRDCKPGREKRVLDPADLIRMLDAMNLREQVIFRLATCEVMRPGEVLALQPADVHESFVSVTRRLYKGHIDTPPFQTTEAVQRTQRLMAASSCATREGALLLN